MLKTDQKVVDLEDEGALMRSEYDEALEEYNTRIQKFPEALNVRGTRFGSTQFLRSGGIIERCQRCDGSLRGIVCLFPFRLGQGH